MQQRWLVFALVIALAGVSWAVLVWPAPEPELGQGPEAQPEPAPPLAAAPPAPPRAAPDEPAEPKAAQAQPTEAPSPSAPAEAQAEEPPLFEHDVGPVAAYKERFGSEPRDSAANDAELLIRDAFQLSDSPSPVFRSVLCRKTLCKVEVSLKADQLGAYVAAMTRITQHFDKELAVTRTAHRAGEVSLEVYAQRPSKAE